MKKASKTFATALATLMTLMTLFSSIGVSAAVAVNATIDPSKTCTILIDYQENIDGDDPVIGAQFTYYKVAVINDQGGYDSIIEGVDEFSDKTDPNAVLEIVKKAYEDDVNYGAKYTTDPTNVYGQAIMEGMEQGLYLGEESTPADHHFASVPFLVSLPHTNENQWVYTSIVNPKSLPGGDLIIKKTVTGNGGETDRAFSFTVEFENYTDPVAYEHSGGETGFYNPGDIIHLKHGETITLDTIPVGLSYKVTEKEADTEGYETVSTGETGNIRRTTQAICEYTNHKTVVTDEVVQTGDTYIAYFAGGIFIVAFLVVILLFRAKKEK